jgi:pimeloyl-ACP methyl ester carboxylesterase
VRAAATAAGAAHVKHWTKGEARMAVARVNGVELYFHERGDGSPLLLIHGTQPDADAWGQLPELLAARHRVVAYDRRGFSRSRHAPITDYVVHAADAAAVLEHLQTAPAVILGWSWGALVALELARKYPALVSSLVLVEPAVHLKKHATLALVWTALAVQLLRRVRGDAAAAEHFLRWAHGYRTGGSALNRFPDAVRAAIRANGGAVVSEFDAGTGEALRPEQIAEVRCPVTLVVGELSRPEFHEAVARLHKLLPRARVRTIRGASHAVHFDRPHDLAAAVDDLPTQTQRSCTVSGMARDN